MPEIIVKSQTISSPQVGIEQEQTNPMILTYFNIDQSSVSADDTKKINDIGKYLQSINEDEFEQAKELKNIRFRLGTPSFGGSEIDHIHKYIQLRRALSQTEEQVKEMER